MSDQTNTPAPGRKQTDRRTPAKARRMACRRQGLPQRFLAREHRRQARRALRRKDAEDAGSDAGRGQGRRPHHAQARHGQGQLHHHPGPVRPHPALRQRDGVGEDVYADFKTWDIGDIVGCVGTLFKTKTGELSVKAARSACSPRACARCPTSSTASPTSKEVPPALRRPDHERGIPLYLRGPQPHGAVDPQLHDRPRLPRGRDADDAPHPGRRLGQALRHPPQRARHAAVPAHRARALPQAPGGGRLREGLRGQPQLPQRRPLAAPQPRIHDDGVLRGVRELPHADGLHRGPAPPRRARGAGHRSPSSTRAASSTCPSPSTA
jgi:hypothetical protein